MFLGAEKINNYNIYTQFGIDPKSLKAILASLPSLDEDFPEIIDLPGDPEMIF